MEKLKTKIIAILTAGIMTITGCKLNNFLNKDEISKPIKEIDETSVTTEPTEEIPGATVDFIEPEITEETFLQESITELIIGEELVTANDNINVYSSNKNDSLVIGKLKIYESAYRILSLDNNWDLIRCDEGIGYVCSDFLVSTNELIETDYQHEEYNDIVLTTTDLNFRTSPNEESTIIRTFRINTELKVIGKVDNGWLLVNYNGTIGYVYGDYTISLLERAQEKYLDLNLEELNTQKVVYVNASDLNIRKGPGTDYERDGNLVRLESARVLKEIDDWYFIMTNEYTFGFINKNYTKTLEGIFVIVDLSVQRLYLYNNNELYCVASVTTGKDKTPSDIGLFSIWYKGTNEEIIPNYLVDYWMPYNSSYEGLHDAERWRSEYGMHTEDEIQAQKYRYNGSNGCINMQRENAKLVYENVTIGTKVLVHK